MVEEDVNEKNHELLELCAFVKDFIMKKQFSECDEIIRNAMGKFPHAPHPHNLMGIQLEKEGDHISAMKHFRAAWALDPAYLPARYNMEQYADFFNSVHKDAYFVEDCFEDDDEPNKNK